MNPHELDRARSAGDDHRSRHAVSSNLNGIEVRSTGHTAAGHRGAIPRHKVLSLRHLVAVGQNRNQLTDRIVDSNVKVARYS